tara:strand:- start:897 stop:1121 length:225 start_codon:yes stop_codon:yes gene_type:complete
MKSSPLHKGIGKYTKKAKGKRGFNMKNKGNFDFGNKGIFDIKTETKDQSVVDADKSPLRGGWWAKQTKGHGGVS